MKKILPILLLTVASLISGGNFTVRAQAPLSVDARKQSDVVPGVLYIQLKAKHGIDFEHLSPTHTGNTNLDRLFANIGVFDIYPFDTDAKNYAVARRHGIDRMYVINFSAEGRSPRNVANEILYLDVIEKASPRLIFQTCYTPNDPDIGQQYALDNMHIKDAWGISEGSANIVIADVDEGVNYNHEDLAGNIYKIDGHYGYNVVGSVDAGNKFHPTYDPMPPPGFNHGTMTSGCFGAVPDNSKGGAGSGFKCKIMAIRISDSTGTLVGGWEGIQFAIERGAKIINCSWGVPLNLKLSGDRNYFDFHQIFIDEALDTGALIVASAGNAGTNNDDSTFIPANFNGVLSVGATDQTDVAADKITNGVFSTNYGSSVNVYAPGVKIFSTSFPGDNAYATEYGTSFSCPLTAGIAGLVLAKNPDWTPKFVMRQIIETCDNVVKPSDRFHYWGRVNAYSALSRPTVPGLGISDYKVDGVDKGGLNYSNKVYSLDVTFKNYMNSGTGIQARLLPIDGSVTPEGGYTVQQGTAVLGSMNSLQSAVGSFKFTRDGTDNGAGSQLPLYFAVSYGSATVEGSKYYDTLLLNINITGDGIFTSKVVEEGHSNILQLGNTYPNPVSSDGSITFELGKQEYARLGISDVLGRTLGILSDGIFDSGSHRIPINARTLENGVYIYKLETADGTVVTRRFIVVH